MSIVYKVIRTPNDRYLYDRNSNSIVSISKSEYELLKAVEQNSDDDLPIIKKLQSKNLAMESTVEEIEHPESKYLQHTMESKVEKITLQLTQKCNLRCSYCAYSGNYDGQRSHANKTMPVDIMYRAIDFLMRHSREFTPVDIGLYGGEPLLHMELIKACFSYVDDNYEDKAVHYSITTNGTLLDEEFIRLTENRNISVVISLDGPEEVHDANRIMANGKGSFRVIRNRLQFIKDHYPGYLKKISFNTVVGPNVNYNAIIKFYENDPFMKNFMYQIGLINEYGLAENLEYPNQYIIGRKIESTKTLLHEAGKLDRKFLSKGYYSSVAAVKYMHQYLNKRERLPARHHPGGPCVPGQKRLFIDVDGDFYPCERVPENIESMMIGNVYSGFDYEKMVNILNIGKLTENECKECWCFMFCKACVVGAVGKDGISREIKLSRCADIKRSVYYELYTLCFLKEQGVFLDTQEEGYE